jgi:ubiquinol-cytochrome c reductase cytochrome b subunit
VIVLMGGLLQINPVWTYGPYNPAEVTAGSQPDWYMGWLEGALRLMPNWEINALGHTLSLNILVPALIVPGILFTLLGLYPFIEMWVTGDRRPHHLLDRPRNAPTRTALGATAITFYLLLWIGGGNDIIASHFDLSINVITWTIRVLLLVLPPIAYVVTRRICLALQRRDRDKLLHGYETGNVLRLPTGEFVEVHAPVSTEERAQLLAGERYQPVELETGPDSNGVQPRVTILERVRAKVSRWYFEEQIPKPTPAELEHAQHHAPELTDGQVRELETSHTDGES